MNKEIPPYKVLETMGVLAAASLIFGLIFKVAALLFLALALLIVGLFIKGLARLITRGWLKFAEVVGGINSRIILAAVFYLFLTPIALVFRMIHGDFMRLVKQEKATTYFTERKHRYGPDDLKNPW